MSTLRSPERARRCVRCGHPECPCPSAAEWGVTRANPKPDCCSCFSDHGVSCVYAEPRSAEQQTWLDHRPRPLIVDHDGHFAVPVYADGPLSARLHGVQTAFEAPSEAPGERGRS